MKIDPTNIMERAETKTLPVSSLVLDQDNVRLKHVKSPMSEAEMEVYFWNEKATEELYAQIKAAKGLYQELIVTNNNVVKEGNRRLVCLRKLGRDAHGGELGVPQTQFDMVKCNILPRDTTEREISLLLTAIHVRGKKAWNAFNKAKMLAYLHSDLKISYDSMSRELGMSKVTIIKAIKSYEATKKYSERFPEDASWHRNYSYFNELYTRRTLKEWRDNPENLLLFFSWIHEGKIDHYRKIRNLNKILETERSFKIFDERGFDAAMEFLNSIDPTINDSDFRRISQTIRTLQSFDRKALIRIIDDPSRKKILQNLKNEIKSLLSDVQALEGANKKREEEVIEE